jgi:hypothetical protein
MIPMNRRCGIFFFRPRGGELFIRAYLNKFSFATFEALSYITAPVE